jgi:hypothetical protein
MDVCCRRRGGASGRGFRSGRPVLKAPLHASFKGPTPEEEMGYLEDMAGRLEENLKGIRERIEKLRSMQ